MGRPFSVAPHDLNSDRSEFSYCVEPLDRYFKTQVGQDFKRRVTACFTAVDSQGRVAGFYALAPASILLIDLPDTFFKKLPRYPSVPAVLMGRLAVDQAFKGRGFGAALLADALRRAATAEIAAYALVVDAEDDHTADLYAHHGFRAALGNPLLMYSPLATAMGLIK